MGGRGAGTGMVKKISLGASEPIIGRSVYVEYGTKSGTVTLEKIKPWKGGQNQRIYFNLSHKVKDFPTKGFVDVSGNAYIKPMQVVVNVRGKRIIVEDGFTSGSKAKKAEIETAITKLFEKRKKS